MMLSLSRLGEIVNLEHSLRGKPRCARDRRLSTYRHKATRHCHGTHTYTVSERDMSHDHHNADDRDDDDEGPALGALFTVSHDFPFLPSLRCSITNS